jgi:hypothetical protein
MAVQISWQFHIDIILHGPFYIVYIAPFIESESH